MEPKTINIWAEARDVPGNVCSDARLRQGGDKVVDYPDGSTYGQAGWDIGMSFESLEDLVGKLNKKTGRQPIVSRLAIHVHGNIDGLLLMEGGDRPDRALTPENLRQYHRQLKDIQPSLTQNATVLFVGCLAGSGKGGSKLLEILSHEWPGRKIVAFTTIGYVGGAEQSRPGAKCTEPGMRDTDSVSPQASWQEQQRTYGPIWKDLKKLPWASEKSDHAKVAVNGKVIQAPKEYEAPTAKPYWLDKELYFAWQALVRAKKSHRDYTSELTKFQRILADRDRKDIRFEDPPWKN